MRQRQRFGGSVAARACTARCKSTWLQSPLDGATAALQQTEVRQHQGAMDAAIARGWPRVMVLNRKGAEQRRQRLLAPAIFPTRAGFDRDEYPAAVGRGRANGKHSAA